MSILIIFVIINLVGLYMYSNWHFTGVEHRQQALVDFLCPIGCLVGRLMFKFDMKTNRFAYVYGLIFEILAFIILLCIL